MVRHSRWNRWNEKVDSGLIPSPFHLIQSRSNVLRQRRVLDIHVPASEHRSEGGQPVLLGVGTMLQGCSNISSGGRPNANLGHGHGMLGLQSTF
jgi:hypothetical protein